MSTYYLDHIRPRLVEHPEWRALTRELADAQRKVQELSERRINFETAFVMRVCYPTAED